MKMFFPFEYGFSKFASDGLHGKPVESASVIYIYDDCEQSESFEEVILKTSLSDVIDEFIENHAPFNDDKIINVMSIKKARMLQEALIKEVDKLERSIET